MFREQNLRVLFSCEEADLPAAILLGRIFLFFGAIGLVAFRYIHGWMEPELADSLWDRYVFAFIYLLILAYGFTPRMSRRRFVALVDFVFLFVFPAHSIWVLVASGFAHTYLIIIAVVIQMLYLPTRNRVQVWTFFGFSQSLLIVGLLLSPPFEVSNMIFIVAIILVVSLVSALVSEARIRRFSRLKEEEAARIKSESTYRALLASSEDLIFSITPSLHLQASNEAFQSFCQRYLGRNLKAGDSIHPLLVRLNWHGHAREVMQEVMKGTPHVSEMDILQKRGNRHFQISLFPVRQGDKITGVSGFGRDISVQKQNQDLLAGLMANSLSGIMSLQALRRESGEIVDFVWTSINGAATRMIPFLSEAVIGKASREVIPVTEGWSLVDLAKWVVESGQPVEQEIYVNSPLLKKRWFHLSVVKLKDGVAITFMDITQRKKTEKEYQTLSLVASHAKDAIVITDANGRIEWFNASFESLTGYSLEELKGKKPGPILQGEATDKATVARIREQISARKPFTEEILNYHKDGHPYWTSVSFSPVFDERGKLKRFIAIKSDVTERMRAAKELEQAKEAAEAAAVAKSEFLATMSHEIRTPMNAVIGLTSLLVESDLDKEQFELLETIRISGENLLTIINDILDFSKIEAGKMQVESQPFCLRDSLHAIIDLLSARCRQKGLELHLKVDEDVPEYISSDPTRLSQILMNLIGNGIKFTEQGSVSVRVSRAPEEFQEAGNREGLLFQVVDTGIGIPSEKLNQLFQSFSQIDPTITRRFGGTGLGLVISKRLVELMGGQIWVTSRESLGSRFSFTLSVEIPAYPEIFQLNHPAEEKEWGQVLADLRILIVEDNIINQKVATKSLAKLGLEAEVVGNGALALEALASHPYDLIFMDMQMPVMDGLTATREIRKRWPGQPLHPLIVAMTANAMAEDRQKCMDAGMNDYISKPIRLEDIRNTLFHWFGQEVPQTSER